jgi:bile acid:Na+ symporter, BASS family
MESKQIIILALQISIWVTVLSFGLKAQRGVTAYLARNTNLLARAIVAMLVVMPVVAIILARVFDFDPNVEVALIALSLAPIPPLLPGKETKAGGSSAFAIGLMAVLGLLSIVTIPASLELLERLFGIPLRMPPAGVAGVVLKSIIAPLLVGLAVRGFAPALADRLAGPVSKLAGVLLLLGAVPLLIAVLPTVLQLASGGTLLAIVLFNVIGLTVGHLMGGPDPDQAVVLGLSTASRHPMIAISIAMANRSDPRVGATIVLALLVNAVVGGVYVAWHRRQHPIPAVGVRHA